MNKIPEQYRDLKANTDLTLEEIYLLKHALYDYSMKEIWKNKELFHKIDKLYNKIHDLESNDILEQIRERICEKRYCFKG